MKRSHFFILLLLPLFSTVFFSCGNSSGSIEDVSWLIGSWKGTDLNDLVFTENWERESPTTLVGAGATISPDGDTIFRETLKIDLVDGTPYYVATIPKSKGPVLFKLIKGDAHNAIFENKEHDFPKRISYLLQSNNTCKIKLEGIEKGIPRIETLMYERVNNKPLDRNFLDSTKKDTAPAPINLKL
jgi:hypothetical protein